MLRALRDGGPQRVDQLAARLSSSGRRPIRPATIAGALEELHAAGLVAVDVDDQDVTAGRWAAVPAARDPLLEAVDLHGAHDCATPTPPGWRTPVSRRGSLTS
jgi:DNA-binding HxlR family transcriptional regulator